jgi:hypothetical protein
MSIELVLLVASIPSLVTVLWVWLVFRRQQHDSAQSLLIEVQVLQITLARLIETDALPQTRAGEVKAILNSIASVIQGVEYAERYHKELKTQLADLRVQLAKEATTKAHAHHEK